MQKLASQIIGSKILTRKERVYLGDVTDVIISDETGDFLGFLFEIEIKGDKQVLAGNANQIKGIGAEFVMIDTLETTGPVNEIIRIKEVVDRKIRIIGSKVKDEDGRLLGKVSDFTLNLDDLKLSRLYVRPSNVVKLFTEGDLIIPASKIISIEKGLIVVANGKAKAKAKAMKRQTVTEIAPNC